MTTTDRLDRWSLRIAERVAPGETALAAQTARAYAAGGATRRNLFTFRRHAPGGMGGGTVTVLPEVLDALAYAAEAVKSALGSAQLGNALSATALVLAIRSQRSGNAPEDPGTSPTPTGTAQQGDSLPSPGSQGAPVFPQSGAAAGAPPQPSAAPTVEVVRAALRISGRLQARGIETASADELAARVTSQLLAEVDPVEVAAFLDALVGDEPPQPAPRAPGPGRTGLRRVAAAASGLLSRVGRAHPTTDNPPSSGPDGTNP
ncbi:hypothetical protein [Streptomyces sp. NPDC060065]|uniref:hypothetical protein n=1 Tax=Streptomyces sp. NPDC060065 TaxID=3347050 RepID=UPI00368AE473